MKGSVYSRADIDCLASTPLSDDHALRNRLFAGSAMLRQFSDVEGAEQTFRSLARSDKGQYSADVHHRLARLYYEHRKAYAPALASATAAWKNRSRFLGDRKRKMFDVLLMLGSSHEQLFYQTGEARHRRQAVLRFKSIVEDGGADAALAEMVGLAQKGLDRIEGGGQDSEL